MPNAATELSHKKRTPRGDVSLLVFAATMSLGPRIAHAQEGRGNGAGSEPPNQGAPGAAYGGAAYETPPPDGSIAPYATFEPQPVAPPPTVKVPAALALQGFAVASKAMPGVAVRLGKYWGPRVEASFLWTTAPKAGVGAFLGNQFGFYLEGTPVRSSRFELNVGLGADVYYLWGIHGDLAKIALSAEANLSYWATPTFGGCLGVRGYPLQSQGLELGTRFDGSAGTPILMTAGIQWRTP